MGDEVKQEKLETDSYLTYKVLITVSGINGKEETRFRNIQYYKQQRKNIYIYICVYV